MLMRSITVDETLNVVEPIPVDRSHFYRWNPLILMRPITLDETLNVNGTYCWRKYCRWNRLPLKKPFAVEY